MMEVCGLVSSVQMCVLARGFTSLLLAVSLLSISETHAGNKLLVMSSNRTNVFAL